MSRPHASQIRPAASFHHLYNKGHTLKSSSDFCRPWTPKHTPRANYTREKDKQINKGQWTRGKIEEKPPGTAGYSSKEQEESTPRTRRRLRRPLGPTVTAPPESPKRYTCFSQALDGSGRTAGGHTAERRGSGHRGPGRTSWAGSTVAWPVEPGVPEGVAAQGTRQQKEWSPGEVVSHLG